MAKIPVGQVIQRYNSAKAKKDTWESVYEDCYRFALPNRNLYEGYYEGGVVGQNKMADVFDSTAIDSTQKFANRIQSGLFPPQTNWAKLEPGNDIPLEAKQEVQEVLEAYSDKMFSVIRNSNFDLSMGEFLLDLAVGTGVMLIQPGDESTPIRFTAIPMYLVCLEEGNYGQVENVYRKMKCRAEQIQGMYPDAKLSQNLKDAARDRPTQEIELLEATIKDLETGHYHYSIIHVKEKHLLVDRKLDSSPWVVSRYMKAAGEVYGRGPLTVAIPDIKTLNKVKELLLKNASLSIAGIYTAADDGVLNPNTMVLKPGAIIPVARNGGPQGESLKPLARSGDPQLSQIVIDQLVTSIKKIMLDESIPRDDMSARSATEIQQRVQELAQNLGSAFGRLITEVMTPIIQRTLTIMDQQGLIELPLKINGLEVKITPVSPIAMSQNSNDVNNVVQFAQIVAQLGPEGTTALKIGEITDYIAEKLGVPASLRNSPEERAQIIQQTQEMAQQQMQAEQEQAMPEQPPTEE
tara:strand:+ start:1227 stop:2789 length:1563 start_codon:yes stop_codon:yes gene_type:complete